MKEKEGFVDCPEQQMILFVEKENGEYGPMQTGSYITKHYIEDFFDKRKRLIASLKQQVEKQEISPVRFFMVLEDLTLNELAARTRFPLRKVKKHMNPAHFRKLTAEQLDRYAMVFHVSVAQLCAADASSMEEQTMEGDTQ